MDCVWSHFANYLHFIWRAYDVRIHAFVLMSNHFHLVISTPQANLDEAMNYLLREVSKRINEETGRVNQVFGGPYHWSLITNWIHYQHVYKYVYRNPVQAGICSKVQDYRYSSLPGILGMDYLYIPAYDNTDLIQNPMSQLKWLNNAFDEDTYEAIGTALRRKEFGFARDNNSMIHPLNYKIV